MQKSLYSLIWSMLSDLICIKTIKTSNNNMRLSLLMITTMPIFAKRSNSTTNRILQRLENLALRQKGSWQLNIYRKCRFMNQFLWLVFFCLIQRKSANIYSRPGFKSGADLCNVTCVNTIINLKEVLNTMIGFQSMAM